jgi:hypothetical protein
MNILLIAQYDWSGAGYALAEAINQHTDHQARHVTLEGQTYLEYPHDILKPDLGELRRLIDWADVLNLHDDQDILGGRLPVVKTYHGSYYRQDWNAINEGDKSLGYHQTCLTIDLSLYGPRWIGRPITLNGEHDPDPDTFKVIHAPTDRAKKGTALVVEALGDLDGVELEIIEKVTNAECLKRKAKGHILVDQMGPNALGYGTNALEAWALGMPVVSSAPDTLRLAFAEALRTTGLPFVSVGTADELRDAVETLRDDEELYRFWANAGRDYLRLWHDPANVAERFIEVCERLV